MEYCKAEKISLKPHFDELWLQDIIEKDPSIIGLGDIEVLQRERQQSSGGRIDFLMSSSNGSTMYEVDVMLGQTDASHIIRTIEYWDIEKRRFPSKEHKAVIIAEDITNRFFNVISLMNKSIPIIAIQLNVLKHENNIFLDFVKVLDIYESPEDELSFETVDRPYWESKAAKKSIKILDKIIESAKIQYNDLRVTYNKHHIALGTITRNFMWVRPRKTDGYCNLEIMVGTENMDNCIEHIEAMGITYSSRGDNKIVFSITSDVFNKNIPTMELFIKLGLEQSQ